MSEQWDYQLRIDLADELAAMARHDPGNPAIRPLADVLARYRATAKCQFDAFAEYVAEAEKQGTEGYPLYAWTKATIENPEKKAKYLKSFTVYVDGKAVYAKPLADALEAGLNRARLRIQARQWLLSKALPRSFGEKVEITTPPEDRVRREWTDLEIARRLAWALSNGVRVREKWKGEGRDPDTPPSLDPSSTTRH
jgi:hypothetical protein